MDNPTNRLETMVEMAKSAERLGFDGVTSAEHHRGRAGYMPNPLQLATMYLHETDHLWSGGCPMILPVRVPATLAEDLAWLAARFPDRVGMVFGSGADYMDFDALGVPFEGRGKRFEEGFKLVADVLSGRGAGSLAADPAVARCLKDPVPLASASMTRYGVRLAARCGVGVAFGRSKWRRGADWDAYDRAFGFGTAPRQLRTLLDIYEEAGGVGPRIYTPHVFIGEPPPAIREGILGRAQAGAESGEPPRSGRKLGLSADEIVEDWMNALADGMDCIDMRIPFQDMPLEVALEQFERLGEEVLPAFRRLRSS
jgi:hypothetical protein